MPTDGQHFAWTMDGGAITPSPFPHGTYSWLREGWGEGSFSKN